MVLGRVWRFMKRNRGKLVVVGAVAAGAYAAVSYMKNKLAEYQEHQMAEAFEKARKQAHYDSNQKTCDTTVLSLFPKLREMIMRELDCEKLTEQLQHKPSNKIHLWNELKILSFTRSVLSIYSTCILILTLRVQLNVIGGLMYCHTKSERSISGEDNKILDQYLSSIQYFLEEGLMKLCDAVKLVVEKELLSVSLKQRMTQDSFENLLTRIRRSVEGNRNGEQHVSPFVSYIISRNSRAKEYIDPGLNGRINLDGMLNETEDIIASEDFDCVLNEALDQGFNFLFKHMGLVFDKEIPPVQPLDGRVEVSLPLAKLIPPLSGSIHVICTDTADKYLLKMFSLEMMNDLGQNLYEAFCTPVAAS